MDRQLIAYLLIAVLVVIAAAAIFYSRYHSHERTYRRQRVREGVAQGKRRRGRANNEA
jgi:hypothetical protein